MTILGLTLRMDLESPSVGSLVPNIFPKRSPCLISKIVVPTIPHVTPDAISLSMFCSIFFSLVIREILTASTGKPARVFCGLLLVGLT